MTTLRPAQIEAMATTIDADLASVEVATGAAPKRKGRPNYSYRAMRRNGCIRFGHYKWADFQRVRPWTWRQVAA